MADVARGLLPVLLLLPFAGCVGEDAAPLLDEGTGTAPPDASRHTVDAAAAPLVDGVPVPAPDWDVGDAWEVELLESGDGATVVVIRDSGTSYELATTSTGIATWDALDDVSYIGPVQASDLAGAQRGEPVRFFAFPMLDGMTWTTQWDGRQITLTTRFSPSIDTFLGSQPGFVIEGVDEEGAPYVAYDYVPALSWWSRLEFEGGWGIRVTKVASNWTGAVLRSTPTPLLTLASSTPVGPVPAATFTVHEGQASLHMFLEADAAAGVRTFALTRPDGAPYMTGAGDLAFGAFASRHYEALPALPGEWRVGAPTLHDPAGRFSLSFTEVALEAVPFG